MNANKVGGERHDQHDKQDGRDHRHIDRQIVVRPTNDSGDEPPTERKAQAQKNKGTEDACEDA